jgi:hypothetical protein
LRNLLSLECGGFRFFFLRRGLDFHPFGIALCGGGELFGLPVVTEQSQLAVLIAHFFLERCHGAFDFGIFVRDIGCGAALLRLGHGFFCRCDLLRRRLRAGRKHQEGAHRWQHCYSCIHRFSPC